MGGKKKSKKQLLREQEQKRKSDKKKQRNNSRRSSTTKDPKNQNLKNIRENPNPSENLIIEDSEAQDNVQIYYESEKLPFFCCFNLGQARFIKTIFPILNLIYLIINVKKSLNNFQK
jgi:hypothetical protein